MIIFVFVTVLRNSRTDHRGTPAYIVDNGELINHTFDAIRYNKKCTKHVHRSTECRPCQLAATKRGHLSRCQYIF